MGGLYHDLPDAVGNEPVHRLGHVVDCDAVALFELVNDDLAREGAADLIVGIGRLELLLDAADRKVAVVVIAGAEAGHKQDLVGRRGGLFGRGLLTSGTRGGGGGLALAGCGRRGAGAAANASRPSDRDRIKARFLLARMFILFLLLIAVSRFSDEARRGLRGKRVEKTSAASPRTFLPTQRQDIPGAKTAGMPQILSRTPVVRGAARAARSARQGDRQVF